VATRLGVVITLLFRFGSQITKFCFSCDSSQTSLI
jgi:hypothetical protein